jgi:hypothetical protein
MQEEFNHAVTFQDSRLVIGITHNIFNSMRAMLRVMIYIENHWDSSVLSIKRGVHTGARALLDMKLLWFGYIARLSHARGRRGVFYKKK